MILSVIKLLAYLRLLISSVNFAPMLQFFSKHLGLLLIRYFLLQRSFFFHIESNEKNMNLQQCYNLILTTEKNQLYFVFGRPLKHRIQKSITVATL